MERKSNFIFLLRPTYRSYATNFPLKSVRPIYRSYGTKINFIFLQPRYGSGGTILISHYLTKISFLRNGNHFYNPSTHMAFLWNENRSPIFYPTYCSYGTEMPFYVSSTDIALLWSKETHLPNVP